MDLTIQQLKTLLPLLDVFRSEENGNLYYAKKTPDGDNGWVSEWYQWNGESWNFAEDVPGDVNSQFDPYG